MINKIREYVEKNQMLSEEDGVVLGVSGGADSVCLFFIMLELKKVYHLRLVVVHVNHGIRGEAAKEDEEYVKELCQKENVIFECVCEDVRKLAEQNGMSEEEAGRHVRYEAFQRACKKYGCNKIAVAHNKNDQGETVLFHLCRGSGLKGLTGMEPVRNNILRPLLIVERMEIEEYLEKRNIRYRIDTTNFETIYTRNKIRLELIPYLTNHINQQSLAHIIETANMLREVEVFVENYADTFFEMFVTQEKEAFIIPLPEFERENIVVQRAVIRKIYLLLAKKLKDIQFTHINSVIALLGKETGKKITLPYGMEGVRGYTELKIQKRKPVKKKEVSCVKIEEITSFNQKFIFEDKVIEFRLIEGEELDEIKRKKIHVIPKNDYTKWFDYDKIKNTVLLRGRKPGDFFCINQKGNRKKLKEFLIEEKIPSEKRDSIQLLADGNHIMWIIGFRISEYYKVSERTQRILLVNIIGGTQT
ncbi:tRNA lysidine(34) synthetase TilS [Anaeromicropila populeti]|uniref:tRNA(Ile)-lysidine synthase n=1 Tax=Anaeromicropila populeti TaxID=37658 RepID=A0A1I6IYC6_9FIRM|nr:tRNA lysidine(34) synthetase TilS [Anaeromicropila populeti]SFR71717.1 tRNA(Ile)-lysidine synthase [Anaeromicropila populeti]